MHNEDTELLFPLRVVPDLYHLRDTEWDRLLERVQKTTASLVEQKAFTLMLVRMGGCMTCNADSFRAMRGCTQCAQRTVKRIREEGAELLELFEAHCAEMRDYLKES